MSKLEKYKSFEFYSMENETDIDDDEIILIQNPK